MEEIGNIIYQRRMELGLTLEEVGKAVGVGKSTVRKWEKGMIKNMGRDKVAALAKALNINPAKLIRPSDEFDPDEANALTSRLQSTEEAEEDKVLFRLFKNATPEAKRAAIAFLKTLEETNSEF